MSKPTSELCVQLGPVHRQGENGKEQQRIPKITVLCFGLPNPVPSGGPVLVAVFLSLAKIMARNIC